MELKYTRIGDYKLPNLTLNNNEKGKINNYGMLRLDYLKQHKKVLYTTLLMQDKLTDYLISVDKECNDKFNLLMKQFIKQENVTEELKANNQIEWVCRMNNIKNRVEEIIFNELIYV